MTPKDVSKASFEISGLLEIFRLLAASLFLDVQVVPSSWLQWLQTQRVLLKFCFLIGFCGFVAAVAAEVAVLLVSAP